MKPKSAGCHRWRLLDGFHLSQHCMAQRPTLKLILILYTINSHSHPYICDRSHQHVNLRKHQMICQPKSTDNSLFQVTLSYSRSCRRVHFPPKHSFFLPASERWSRRSRNTPRTLCSDCCITLTVTDQLKHNLPLVGGFILPGSCCHDEHFVTQQWWCLEYLFIILGFSVSLI